MTLHLVRRAPPPEGAVAAGDVVLHDRDGVWIRDRTPVDDAELVELVFRADRVAVW